MDLCRQNGCEHCNRFSEPVTRHTIVQKGDISLTGTHFPKDYRLSSFTNTKFVFAGGRAIDSMNKMAGEY